MSKPLLIIDGDLVQRLKREGRYSEAQELLRGFRENAYKMWKQEKKELIRVDVKKRIVSGFCSNLGCPRLVRKDETRCLRCVNSNKKRYLKLKTEGMCVYCAKNKVWKDGVSCSSCLVKKKKWRRNEG